jgi:hypothetical protein
MNKDKLKRMVQEEITMCFQEMLDYAQVACPEANYKPLRSKILRVGNNAVRNICAYINENMEDE